MANAARYSTTESGDRAIEGICSIVIGAQAAAAAASFSYASERASSLKKTRERLSSRSFRHKMR